MTTSFSYTEPLAIETDIFSLLRVPKYENISTNAAAAIATTAIVYNGISGKLFYSSNLKINIDRNSNRLIIYFNAELVETPVLK
jgi:hypothetical protein